MQISPWFPDSLPTGNLSTQFVKVSLWLKVAPPNFFEPLKIHSNGTWAFLRLRFRNNLGFFSVQSETNFSIRETGHRRVCQKLGRFRFSEIAASMKSRWWSNEKLEKFGYRDQFFKQPKIPAGPQNSGYSVKFRSGPSGTQNWIP